MSQNTRSQFATKRRQDLVQMVKGLNLLPSSYAAPMRLLQLHRSGTASMSDFADAISSDPGLTAKILSLVNSAAFGASHRIERLTQALAMIGIKNLMPLAFGFSLAGIFNKLSMPAAERGPLWKASLLKAVAARELALSIVPDLSEEAFLGGLLQDLAAPVFYTSDRSAWPEMLAALQIDNEQQRQERELRVYGIDHAELGGMIAAEMQLPEMYRVAIAKHHEGVSALRAVGDEGLAKVLEIAASISHRIAQPTPQLVQGLALRVRAAMGSSDQSTSVELLKRIVAKFGALLTALGDADESSVAFKAFLQSLSQEIALAMESAVSESTTTITTLKARGTELQEKVTQLQGHAAQSDHDSLTNTFNRRGFFPRAARALALAREYGKPCAVAFIDVDDFKGVNDGHGHAAGDAVLALIGGILREQLQESGIMGRLGGDEFGILLLGKDLPSLQEQVDRVTRAVARFELDLSQVKLPLSASIGVVTIGIPSETDELDKLLNAADKAMYESKRTFKTRAANRPPVRAA